MLPHAKISGDARLEKCTTGGSPCSTLLRPLKLLRRGGRLHSRRIDLPWRERSGLSCATGALDLEKPGSPVRLQFPGRFRARQDRAGQSRDLNGWGNLGDPFQS
jgi:hypothetical protein